MLKTLIISPNWIGDAVMTLPLITKLYKHGHEIHVLAPNIVAPIYENSIYVAKVIQHEFQHKKLSIFARIKLAIELKKNTYKYIYILPNSLKSAIIPFIIKADNIIGYKGEWPRKYLMTQYLTNQGKKLPMVEHYNNLSMLADDDKPNLILQPKIDLKNNETLACLQKFNIADKKYIAMAIGAEYGPSKQWPLENFKTLIDLIHKNYKDIYILLLGSAKDKEAAQSLVQNDKTINLCAKTSLTEAMHIIKKASKVLTHDSGLMHISAAIGTELLAIYGSTSPHHTPPLSNNSKYIWLNLECSPCFKRTCPLKHYACLNGIKPQEVFENLFQS